MIEDIAWFERAIPVQTDIHGNVTVARMEKVLCVRFLNNQHWDEVPMVAGEPPLFQPTGESNEI